MKWSPVRGVRRPVQGILRQCKKYEDELNEMEPGERSAETSAGNIETMQEI
jgi:hypothetical protein